jgi:hypothetical protein
MSRVRMTRNRFANNNARVHIRSFNIFVDNVAANPRLTFFCGSGAGGGARGGAGGGGDVCAGAGGGGRAVVLGAGTATEACNSTGAGDGTSAASGATGALPFLPPGIAVLATVTRAFAPAVVGARATVWAALVSSDVVFGSLVFLVMSQAP